MSKQYGQNRRQEDRATQTRTGAKPIERRFADVREGDSALIYHSGDSKSVVGIAKCVREGYADIEPEDGKEWVQIDIAPVRRLRTPVPLATIKATPELKEMPLIRHTRLSVMPLTKSQFETVLKLSESAKEKSK